MCSDRVLLGGSLSEYFSTYAGANDPPPGMSRGGGLPPKAVRQSGCAIQSFACEPIMTARPQTVRSPVFPRLA